LINGVDHEEDNVKLKDYQLVVDDGHIGGHVETSLFTNYEGSST